MTPEKIRIVMAELDGFVVRYRPTVIGPELVVIGPELVVGRRDSDKAFDKYRVRNSEEQMSSHELPHYDEDLNAIAEFKQRHITPWNPRYGEFQYKLMECVHGYTAKQIGIGGELGGLLNAPAITICEALIKTLAPERWEE